jgi:hypothetical protein
VIYKKAGETFLKKSFPRTPFKKLWKENLFSFFKVLWDPSPFFQERAWRGLGQRPL